MNNAAVVYILYSVFIILYFLALNGTYLFLVFLSFGSLKTRAIARQTNSDVSNFRSGFYKPISIIIPAFNEEKTIVYTVRSALAIRYPQFEVIIVNDGSLDRTLKVLINSFKLKLSARNYSYEILCEKITNIYSSVDYPNLVVIDKINGGKADALNAGINVSQFPLFCNIDSDSLIDSSALLTIVDFFIKDWQVIAAGGTIRVANQCIIKDGQIIEVKLSPNFWVRFQIVEYLRAFLFGRAGWLTLGSVMILSGAFSVFRRSAVITAGGYRRDTVGEDMELTLRIQRKMKELGRKYRVVYIPDPVCWTQVPENYHGLQTQRRRWQRGLAEGLFSNFSIFLNPQYGSVGMVSFPVFLLFEFLGPLIELSGYLFFIYAVITGLLNPPFTVLFFCVAILLGILLSTSSLLMEELHYKKYPKLKDMLILFGFAVLENFFYRQINTWWRVRGLIDFFFSKRDWGSLERKRF